MTDVTRAAPGGDNGAMSTPNGRQVPDWVILSIACVAQFMVVLDVSIVNVALPSIGRDLHYSPTGLQWVVNAYVLTFAGFLLLGGRAADLFGRRRVYLFGLGLFTLASLIGGLAQNAAWLTTRAGRAGHRRRLPVAGHAHHPRHHLHRRTPGQGHRHLECRGRRRRRGRRHSGRRPHGRALLALGPLRQHPHRHRRHRGGPHVPDRGQTRHA